MELNNTPDFPFKDYSISSHDCLKGLKRSKCPKCKASRMYFCYTCYVYVEGTKEDLLPKVKLPVSVDIIKHPKELDGKSTAVHAALLAPNDVHVYSYPIFPNYSSQKDVLLLFPGPNAHSIEYFSKLVEKESSLKRSSENSETSAPSLKRQHLDNSIITNDEFINCVSDDVKPNNLSGSDSPKQRERKPTFKKIVMIDSTWNQVHAISTDERLQGIPCVELTEKNTMYWRKQHNSPSTHLSTIEALHLFFKLYHELFIGEYDKRYDNLLYFFKFFYDIVHTNKANRKKPK